MRDHIIPPHPTPPRKPKFRPMKCDLCGGTDIYTDFDIGCDIDPSGEERQHLDHCHKCGATRLWANRLDFEGPYDEEYVYWEKWDNDPDPLGFESFKVK